MQKILVVDDQPIVGNIYRSKFAAEGFQVDTVADGQQALESIHRDKPDLVLLDFMLPKMDGLEVLKRLRSEHRFANLPVIVFSASGRPNIVEEALAAGATIVVSKTSTGPKQIIKLVRDLLEKSPQPTATTNPQISIVRVANRPGAIGNIVLFETNPDMRAMITHLLKQAGHSVIIMATAEETISFAVNNQIDCFVMGRNAEALRTCNSLRANFRKPIVAYATDASETDQDALLNAGVSRFITTAAELLGIPDILSGLVSNIEQLAA